MSLLQKQLLSYAVTFVFYYLVIPWQAALVLMVSILLHEHGHLWAAKRVGLKTMGCYLIPFFGGIALTSGTPKSYADKAYIAIMGPVAGALFAVITYIIYKITGNQFFGQAALIMAYINLFNLMPLAFLDGGQLLESIVYSLNATAGLVIMSISTLVAIPILIHFNFIIAIIVAFFGGIEIYNNFRIWKLTKLGMGHIFDEQPKSMNKKQLILVIANSVILSIGLYLLSNLIKSDQINMLDMFKK